MDSTAAPPPWRLGRIDFSIAQPQRVRGDETLLFLLATAALVETATHHYASNLAERYADDAERSGWLRHQWAPEELQHGRALRSHVATVWPDTVLDYTDEPLLREIARRLRDDEVRHYSDFYAAANRYRATQTPGRWALLRAVARRVREAFDDDGEIACRHAWAGRYPERPYVAAEYRRFQRELRAGVTPHVPVQMSARMLVKPLALPPWLARPATALPVLALRRAAGARA